MSFTSLLKDTCTIEQKTSAQSSTGAVSPTWTTKASGVPTRKRRNNQPRVYDGIDKTFESDFIFYFLPTVDIAIENRIKDSDGVYYEVLSVAADSEGHHLEVVARLKEK